MKGLVKNAIIFALGFLIALVLIMFGINPALNQISVLHDNISQQKTEALTLDQQILAFKSAQSDLSKATRRDEIDSAIGTRETLADAVKDLEAALAKTNTTHELTIKDPALDKTPPDPILARHPGVEEIPYNLAVTNDYTGVLSALSYLEHLPHFTEIFQIDLTAETNGNGTATARTGRVIGNIQGVFFVKKP